jgi:hypothetical protein
VSSGWWYQARGLGAEVKARLGVKRKEQVAGSKGKMGERGLGTEARRECQASRARREG